MKTFVSAAIIASIALSGTGQAQDAPSHQATTKHRYGNHYYQPERPVRPSRPQALRPIQYNKPRSLAQAGNEIQRLRSTRDRLQRRIYRAEQMHGKYANVRELRLRMRQLDRVIRTAQHDYSTLLRRRLGNDQFAHLLQNVGWLSEQSYTQSTASHSLYRPYQWRGGRTRTD